jgi:hypothetical protein
MSSRRRFFTEATHSKEMNGYYTFRFDAASCASNWFHGKSPYAVVRQFNAKDADDIVHLHHLR